MLEKRVRPLMNCESCGKEVEKKGNRKYCSKCRKIKDKELQKAARERHKLEKGKSE